MAWLEFGLHNRQKVHRKHKKSILRRLRKACQRLRFPSSRVMVISVLALVMLLVMMPGSGNDADLKAHGVRMSQRDRARILRDADNALRRELISKQEIEEKNDETHKGYESNEIDRMQRLNEERTGDFAPDDTELLTVHRDASDRRRSDMPSHSSVRRSPGPSKGGAVSALLGSAISEVQKAAESSPRKNLSHSARADPDLSADGAIGDLYIESSTKSADGKDFEERPSKSSGTSSDDEWASRDGRDLRPPQDRDAENRVPGERESDVPDMQHETDNTDLTVQKQAANDKFRGVELGVVDGVNITKVSFMVFRIIKTYNVTSILDVPCSSTWQWMPTLLERLDFEVPGFQYHCVVNSKEEQKEMQKRFVPDYGNAMIWVMEPDRDTVPSVDMVFSWQFIQSVPIGRAWRFFINMYRASVRYTFLLNNPVRKNSPKPSGVSTWPVNVRKAPFLFGNASRVISDIADESIVGVKQQLLLYDIEAIGKLKRFKRGTRQQVPP